METVDLTAVGASTQLDLGAVAVLERDAVLASLGSGEHGLAGEEARRRLDGVGPNVLRSHGARFWSVLARQFRSFLLSSMHLLTALLAARVTHLAGMQRDESCLASSR